MELVPHSNLFLVLSWPWPSLPDILLVNMLCPILVHPWKNLCERDAAFQIYCMEAWTDNQKIYISYISQRHKSNLIPCNAILMRLNLDRAAIWEHMKFIAWHTKFIKSINFWQCDLLDLKGFQCWNFEVMHTLTRNILFVA